MLAKDQEQAVKEIKSWWGSSKAYHILQGSAGVGKSYVVENILENLIGAKPVLLAPTHKALRQLKLKTHGDYKFATVASSLGIRPIDEGRGLKFEQTKLPSFWDNHNLCIIDEAGMLDDYHIDLFKSLHLKILYVGHKSQLPPIKVNRSITDKCISPVFSKGYFESNLWIPKRNTGALWKFNEILEQRIYDDSIAIPNTYDIGAKEFKDYLGSKETLISINSGVIKVALWTREGVSKYNKIFKDSIFGKTSSPTGFFKDELVVIKNSIVSFNGMEFFNDKMILKHANEGIDIYTDTDGRIIDSLLVDVKLNKNLIVKCKKLTIDTSIEGLITVYMLEHKEDYKRISDYYEHLAWSYSSKQAKDKAYRERSLLLKCFAQVQSFYAATSHSLQGSSIKDVVTILSDINKNSNRIERAKCTYVACSRASNNLITYRGL